MKPRTLTPRTVKPRVMWLLLALLPLALLPGAADAAGAAALTAPGIPAFAVHNSNGGQTYTLTIQLLALMTAITLLPAALLMMTAFTRIVIVLAILRQAIGAGQAPPNQVIVGLALFLTLFVMSPVIDKIRVDAVTPYMAGTIDTTTALERGAGPLVNEDGRQMRNFVDVADVAAANVAAIDRAGGLRAFNVASGEPHSVGEMAEALAAAFDLRPGSLAWPEVTGRYRLGDVRHVFASTTRAANELGCRAVVPFAEGMRRFARAELRDPVTPTTSASMASGSTNGASAKRATTRGVA